MQQVALITSEGWQELLVASCIQQSAVTTSNDEGGSSHSTGIKTYCRSVPDVNISVMKFTEYVF